MGIAQFPILTATTFHKQLDSGRSQPSIVQCVDARGSDAGLYVVKLLGSLESKETGFMCEFMASRLASLLGIPVPEPASVVIEKDFAETIPEPQLRQRFLASVCTNFATKYKSPGLSTWPTGKSIPRDLFEACAEIFAFDVLIQNPDRRKVNPNLLWDAEEIYAYDHETAFSFIQDIIARKNPTGSLTAEKLSFLKDHVFFNNLRKQDLDYARLEGAMLGVTAPVLAQIGGQMPKAWRTSDLKPILEYTEAVCKTPANVTRIARELLA